MGLFSNKSDIPSGDRKFLELCKNVSANYSASNFEIESCTKSQFANLVQTFDNLLNEMYVQRSNRNPAINLIDAARKEHDAKLSYVKAYITEKYGKENANRYFPEFAIERRGGAYMLPFAQDMRAAGLFKLTAALRKHNFIENTYGANYWEPIANKFQNLLELNRQTTGTIAVSSAEKNNIKDQLKKSLTSIRYFMKSRFPDTHKAELRKLGFLKEWL